jgi:hypothetical protein
LGGRKRGLKRKRRREKIAGEGKDGFRKKNKNYKRRRKGGKKKREGCKGLGVGGG